ncbi:hypothetical protein ACHAXR_007347 [Thalassiosira sp. AJA248-18]
MNDHPDAGAGVIVGGASHAVFYDGVTVRGGNHLGADAAVDDQYFYSQQQQYQWWWWSRWRGSNIAIHWVERYNPRWIFHSRPWQHQRWALSRPRKVRGINSVPGGYFYGSWFVVSDQGSIVVNGCVSRIGTRLVGRLENGHSLDVEEFEEGEGKIVVNSSEKCNQYMKPKSSAVSVMGSACYSLLLLGLAAV